MKKLSRCCAAPVEAIHEDEGQSYWLCTSCHNQCGVTDEYQKLNHMINHSTDTTMRYDKGLPRKRRMKEENRCLRCGTNKKFTIKEWNECPWQLADWRASVDFPLLPRFIVHWWYFRNNPKHLLK